MCFFNVALSFVVFLNICLFGSSSPSIERKNSFYKTLSECNFFSTMKTFDSAMNEESFNTAKESFLVSFDSYRSWNYLFRSPESLGDLNILMPLIPPMSRIQDNQDYYEFARCYVGSVAITPELQPKISSFLEKIIEVENGQEKLKNLVMFFLQSQINEYRNAALKKSSQLDVTHETLKKELERINLESSPAFQAAKKLYSINPKLFKDNKYLGTLRGTWKLFSEHIPVEFHENCYKIFEEVKIEVYADFLKKIKNLSSNTEEKNVKPTEKEVVVTDENTGKNTNKSYGCTHWH